MGTGPFAVPSCRRLQEAGHEIALVIVRPPANAKAPPSPVQQWASEVGLPVFQPASINSEEGLARLKACQAELLFVCDYGQILSRDCLSTTKLGGINLHGSLLPRHRGAAPVQWSVLSGDEVAGVSVIHMTPGLDAGPVIALRSTSIAPDENAGQLEARLSLLGAEATLEAIALLDNWDGQGVLGQVQDKSLATKAPRINKRDGALRFDMPAIDIERRVRAYQPWPGTFGDLVFSSSKKISLHVRAARALPDANDASQPPIKRPPGAAWSVSASQMQWTGEKWKAPWDRLMMVQCQEGVLAIAIVQPAGKRAMSVDEFLRGHPLTSEAHFAWEGTP